MGRFFKRVYLNVVVSLNGAKPRASASEHTSTESALQLVRVARMCGLNGFPERLRAEWLIKHQLKAPTAILKYFNIG